jgi:predicted Zn finger-like uncharacterized protein
VKFLCDRCKTRYSIGDERVRGKILKIRCKNCNNVITVREGMDIAADAPRTKQPTQSIEPSGPVAAPGNGALGAAFASAMTKPPPALEEEWYVSIDGEQAGPYSLAEAQRWVAGKPFDAELHCWSEGFDDWLPVDKVSHFRGLRKKPVAPPPVAAPPPIPRAATGAHRAVTRPAQTGLSDDEPKPLFAATMASLEKTTQPPLGSGNFSVPAPQPQTPLPSLRGTPMGGHPAMPQGTRGAPNGNGALKQTPVPGFDASDSATQIETPSFEPPRPDPFAARDLKANPFAAKAPPKALDLTQPIQQEDIDGDLDIGEVSRVVKLADLAKTAPPKIERAQPVARASGQSLSRTGNVSALPVRSSGSSIPPPVIGPDGRQIDPTTGEPIPLAPQVAVSHRRGMIALITGAILLLGAALAVVLMITSDDGPTFGGGLSEYDINTMRPDDPRRLKLPSQPQTADKEPQNPFVPRRPRPQTQQPQQPQPPTNPDAKALRPDEIEEMAGRYSGTTQTCYRRSQRGAEAILLGDLKKLGVTLTVDPNGTVTNVTLSDHSQTSLGRCLIASIKGWKFRESSNGITARITLVFQGV